MTNNLKTKLISLVPDVGGPLLVELGRQLSASRPFRCDLLRLIIFNHSQNLAQHDRTDSVGFRLNGLCLKWP